MESCVSISSQKSLSHADVSLSLSLSLTQMTIEHVWRKLEKMERRVNIKGTIWNEVWRNTGRRCLPNLFETIVESINRKLFSKILNNSWLRKYFCQNTTLHWIFISIKREITGYCLYVFISVEYRSINIHWNKIIRFC